MAGGREQECQSQSSAFSSASGSARAAAGALGPRGAASGAAQRQQLLQSLLQVWQCGFTLYIPPPGGPRPRPRASRSSSSSTAFLPPARSLARSGLAAAAAVARPSFLPLQPGSSRRNKSPGAAAAGAEAGRRAHAGAGELWPAGARRAEACAAVRAAAGAAAAAARLGGGGGGGGGAGL